MAGPYEIVDDLTAFIDGSTSIFRIRKPPYVPGSVSVFLDSLLQRDDYFTELNPVTGEVQLSVAPVQRVPPDAGLHISYLTWVVPYVDPQAPVHISQLKDGDVVRIAMKAGRHLEPIPMRKGLQHRLEPVRVGRMARGHSQTVFLGNITSNNRTQGVLEMQVHYRSWGQTLFHATVPYKDIKVIQKYITPAIRQTRRIEVGGGPNAIRRPGILAKGFYDSAGFMNLIQVRF